MIIIIIRRIRVYNWVVFCVHKRVGFRVRHRGTFLYPHSIAIPFGQSDKESSLGVPYFQTNPDIANLCL
jgi:hypothetical protein